MPSVRSILVAASIGGLLAASPVAHADTKPAVEGPDTIVIFSDADAAAVLNARIAALSTVLELTPDQQKLWPPVEAAIRKIGANATARGKQRSEAAPPEDFLEALDRIGDAEAVRAQELKSFVAAARPLVASLTEAQRNRVPAFLGMVASESAPLSTQSLWLFEEEQR